MVDNIPISFDCNGKKYLCRFSEIRGASEEVWHLMDNRNFYLGRLRQANDKWVFDPTPKTGDLAELADFFRDYLTAWIE